MKLDREDITDTTLSSLGSKVVHSIFNGDFDSLAKTFGYAVALDRDGASALRDDLRQCFPATVDIDSLTLDRNPDVKVKYLEPNDAELVAVVECIIMVQGHRGVLVELVVSGSDGCYEVCIEEISNAV